MIAVRPFNGSITAFDDLILALYPVTAQIIHPPEKWKKAGQYRTAETIYLPDARGSPGKHELRTPNVIVQYIRIQPEYHSFI